MSHQETNEEGHQSNNDTVAMMAVDDDFSSASFGALGVDELANILAFLPIEEIIRSRRINKQSMEAVKMTMVPPADFVVDSLVKYNAVGVMTKALPNLQRLTMGSLGRGYKYSDGEDPDERLAARTADYTTHNIGIISNFSKLRIFEIRAGLSGLNGRYPFLFNSFPLLEKLRIDCIRLKWDLEMLAGFPMLKVLECLNNHRLTGNISSLRVLKDTLEKVEIYRSSGVEGNFMDLADFPHLKELDLDDTAVSGDIRDIGENDFLSLESLNLPERVYGGIGYGLENISDALDLIGALYFLKQQRPALSMLEDWYGELWEGSPDWYDSRDDYFTPPFDINFVQAGSRVGYRWVNGMHSSCEVNWLDPEPERESDDYAKYVEESQVIQRQVGFYRGFHRPPTEEEYRRLIGWESDNESVV